MNIRDLLSAFSDILSTLVPLLVLLAFIAMTYGGIKLIVNAGNEQGRSEGRRILIWGVIALFVMVSIWGIIGFLQADFIGGGGADVIESPRVW